MSCPLCGEVCRCAPETRPAQTRSSMRSRFEPDTEASVTARPAAVVIDAQTCDTNQPQFAASLEKLPAGAERRRFVVEEAEPRTEFGSTDSSNALEAKVASDETLLGQLAGRRPYEPVDPAGATENQDRARTPAQADLLQQPDTSWRQEVVARVKNYRGRRRPRAPRYPSLRLQFEASEPAWVRKAPVETPTPSRAIRQAVAVESAPPEPTTPEVKLAEPMADAAPVAPESAKIIEFPRSANAPPKPLEELAEPVLDRPRILEVPEVAPPPPALGGILIEPAERAANEKRPGFEIPLKSAPLSRRVLAGAIDTVLVLSAFTGFAYIFVRMAAAMPPLQQAGGASVMLAGLFWVAYQYLMLVYAGTTPGLKIAKLQLSRFDGSPAARSLRRWRVLGSVLSAVSLGLGYAWCFLDEDGLCWHDRITRTYMAPRLTNPDSQA
jgi:uncharacterized RDD family membrane protein YckC